MHDSVVQIDALCFSRGEQIIFQDLNLNISKGKITAIMGASGTGKTSLLRLITAQLTPDSGQVLVDGQDIHALSRADLLKVRKNMGFLFQSAALFTNLNVFDNVAFPLREHTMLSAPEIKELVSLKLEAVGLAGTEQLMPSELSGGMARRVALSRAVALDPALVFYDEPFVGQDPITLGVLLELIKRLNSSLGCTSIIVSHDVPETIRIADDICLLVEGRIKEHGTPDALLASRDPYVYQFMNGLPDGAVPFNYTAKETDHV